MGKPVIGDCRNCGEIGRMFECDHCGKKMCIKCVEEDIDGSIVCIDCYKISTED